MRGDELHLVDAVRACFRSRGSLHRGAEFNHRIMSLTDRSTTLADVRAAFADDEAASEILNTSEAQLMASFTEFQSSSDQKAAMQH